MLSVHTSETPLPATTSEKLWAPPSRTVREVTPDTSVLPPTTTSMVPSWLPRVVAPVSFASVVTAASRWSSREFTLPPAAESDRIVLFRSTMFAAVELIVVAVESAAARAAVQAAEAASNPAEIGRRDEAALLDQRLAAPEAAVPPTLLATVCQLFQKLLSCDARPVVLGSFSDVSTVLTASADVLQ